MPISYGTFEKQVKLLPITINFDGSSLITLKYGFIENNNFNVIKEEIIAINAVDTASLLDTLPQAGMTRRNDLALAIYNYLIDNNLIEPGQIT